jgi:hypothetical protein
MSKPRVALTAQQHQMIEMYARALPEWDRDIFRSSVLCRLSGPTTTRRACCSRHARTTRRACSWHVRQRQTSATSHQYA